MLFSSLCMFLILLWSFLWKCEPKINDFFVLILAWLVFKSYTTSIHREALK